MDTAEAVSREEIRSLVASYNAFGDRGRVAELAGLFAPDGTLEIHGGESHVGPAAIEAYLGGVTGDNTARATYWRHFVATHDIEVIDAERATGTAYFLVIDGNGLNHWGRVPRPLPPPGRWSVAVCPPPRPAGRRCRRPPPGPRPAGEPCPDGAAGDAGRPTPPTGRNDDQTSPPTSIGFGMQLPIQSRRSSTASPGRTVPGAESWRRSPRRPTRAGFSLHRGLRPRGDSPGPGR